MGKFRSKLKRHAKGKKWARGQSATSNPENTKHRSKARSRFFQPNLSLAPEQKNASSTTLTLEKLAKHDARLSYSGDNKNSPTVNDIAMSLKSFNFDDEDMSESQVGTFKTFQTFASNYSSCSNMTFNKFLNGFRQSSDLHKEMLAILSAIAEVIREQNGTESSTEYFLALLETLEAAKENDEIIATITLLAMVIKTVPQPVLRKKCIDFAPLLSNLLEQFADKENQNALRSIIGCVSVLLRAQEYSSWSSPQILKLFNQVLSFILHTKPKIRKSSQHAIAAIIHGSCFMAPPKTPESLEDDAKVTQIDNQIRITYHPASKNVSKFCIEQFKVENISKSQSVVLHTLTLLRDTINGFSGDDIKEVCESLLSIMTASKVMIQTNCFHTIHSLFASKSPNLSAVLLGKLIAAIYDYRPENTDVRQTLAWLTVLKEGHVCLAAVDLSMCISALPRLIDVTASDVWMSDDRQIAAGASNALKELLLECVKPCCESEKLSAAHAKQITRILNTITKALSAPFGPVSEQVVLLFATVFEVAGRRFSETLKGPLTAIASRYDEHVSARTQIEHTVLAAIKSMGPEVVLKAFPLADAKGTINVSRSWLLPLLREGINHSTFEFFYTHIYQLANRCYENWQRLKAENSIALAHTNELLYCQLWGLFPGFCRNPTDMVKFGAIAKTLGECLQSRVEIRMPILDGLKELLVNADDECKQQLNRFAKNFLKRLLNIYATKPSGSYENDIRVSTIDVIREYLKVTPDETLVELFNTAKDKFKAMEQVETILERVQQLSKSVERIEDDDKIDENRSKRIQHAHDVLNQLLRGENESSVSYIEANEEEVKGYLQIVPPKRLQNLFKQVKTALGPFVYEAYFDIIVSLAVYQSTEQLKELFDDYIAPTLRSAKKGGVTRLIKERMLKSYELLKSILTSENDGCVRFTNENHKEIKRVLLGTMQENKSNVKAAQLTCLQILLEKEFDSVQSNSKLVSKIFAEVVISFTQAVNKKKENVALALLLKICEIYKREEKLDELVNLTVNGFSEAADSLIHTNTIHVLKAIIQHYGGLLTLSTLTEILKDILDLIKSKSRPEVEASIQFLLLFVKFLPAPYVANHLPDIVRSLSAIAPDPKRFCRMNVGYLYRRLCKRFTAEEIIKLVPGDDEITHKKLKNIRKELARLKRQKAANAKSSSGEESDDDNANDEKPKTATIDDILADSDSDLENDIMMDADEQIEKRPKKKARSRDQKFIHEDADEIVDLADVNAMSRITSTKPTKKSIDSGEKKKKSKDENRGFKTAEDGRLIIADPKRGSRDAESDSDDDDDDDNEKRRQTIGDSDSDQDEAAESAAAARKRKATKSLSVASGKTGTSSRYVAGGKGIHRPMGGAASVRSAASSKATTANVGGEYRSKKAKGDIKKKNTLDPYAYIPLSRSSLNKRKRAKSSGQFKSIVTSARKGAAAGARNKKRRVE